MLGTRATWTRQTLREAIASAPALPPPHPSHGVGVATPGTWGERAGHLLRGPWAPGQTQGADGSLRAEGSAPESWGSSKCIQQPRR